MPQISTRLIKGVSQNTDKFYMNISGRISFFLEVIWLTEI